MPAVQNELVVTRVFDAPPALVWKAWTEPEHFKKWWGPKGFTAPVAKIDLRVGGAFHWCMRGLKGEEYWTVAVYREIVPLKRLVYADSFADEKGNRIPAPGGWPAETVVTVTFEEDHGKTKMTLRHAGMPSGKMSEMAGAGWNQSFDKLAASLV